MLCMCYCSAKPGCGEKNMNAWISLRYSVWQFEKKSDAALETGWCDKHFRCLLGYHALGFPGCVVEIGQSTA